MFQMMNIGRTISALRQEKNMTQMELADRMGVSFQAVSGWERGRSMPDVSRLPELAELFGVPIARILGEETPLVDAAAAGTMEEYLQQHQVTPEELEQAAPVLKPEQLDTALPHVGKLKPEQIRELLPFLSQETLDQMGQEAWNDPEIRTLAPLLEERTVDRIAAMRTEKGMDIQDLLPFMSSAALAQTALACYRQGGLAKAEPYFPFLGDKDLAQLAEMEMKQNGLQELKRIAPFLPEQLLVEILHKLR